MTDDTLRRLMVAQLEKAKETIGKFLGGQSEREVLHELQRDINNCLAIVEAEWRHVKQGDD